jgi:membrane-associated phospholipid phosphatase
MDVVKILLRDLGAIGGFAISAVVLVFVLLVGEIDLFVKLFVGSIVLLGVAALARLVYFKKRPSGEGYKNIIERVRNGSFPSLHTARAVFLALVFGEGVIYLLVFLLIVAALVGYSRIYRRRHDVVDVVFGALLGVVVWLGVGLV